MNKVLVVQNSRQQDVQLVGQVLAGQKDLFANLIQPHVNRLHHLGYAQFRNESDAEDLVQEVVLKAFTKLHQYRGEAGFGTWLTRIAINEAKQWQRRGVVSRIILVEPFVLDQWAIEDRGASPLAECELHEMAESLECALAKLPDQYMIVFRLLDLQHHSIADTAEQLQLSIAAVKSRHRRARTKIRCLLTKMHRIGDDHTPQPSQRTVADIESCIEGRRSW